MKNVHKLTEGAILLAAFTVMLLITLYVPIIGVVFNLFLSLPFIMFAAKNNHKDSLVFLIASLVLTLMVGTLLSIPLTFAYGLTGIVIGDFIRRKKGRKAAYVAGSIALLFNLVLQYAIAVAFFQVNFIDQSFELFRESMEQSFSIMNAIGQEPTDALINQFNNGITMVESLVPSLFVLTSFIIVFFIQLVSYPIAKRFGVKLSESEPFRDISFPKHIMYYFIISFIASLLLQAEVGSYMHVALTNIMFILQVLIIIQGISFILFYSHLKGWPKSISTITIILLLIVPFLLYIVWILGIIDLGFDLRKRLNTTV